MTGHDLALLQHLCFSSYKWQQQDTVPSVLRCGSRDLKPTPAPVVTPLPLESPTCLGSHPCAPGVTVLPRDRLCPSLSQESCSALRTSPQELGPRALQARLPGLQRTSPGMLWEVFPRPGLRPDAIVIFISKQETGSLPGHGWCW